MFLVPMTMQPLWYLPLSNEFSKSLVSGGALGVEQLSKYELAAIVYLLQLPKLASQSRSP